MKGNFNHSQIFTDVDAAIAASSTDCLSVADFREPLSVWADSKLQNHENNSIETILYYLECKYRVLLNEQLTKCLSESSIHIFNYETVQEIRYL